LPDLSVIIASRNEEFLQNTIDEVTSKSHGDTECIVVLDGYWPDTGIKDHHRVTIIHLEESMGQRAAVNMGVKLSQAKYIMKLDAHCKLDDGFDVKLMANCKTSWTVVPRMYNLHAFDWVCECGERVYQANPKCDCGKKSHRELVWMEKTNPTSDFMRFDKDLKFQYWREYKRRPESQGDIVATMSLLGACFFMYRERYWELGGLDEGHGGWGQMGTEIACKSWLSGGQLVVNKKTWFAHMFRTGGVLSFPYPLNKKDTDRAREYSNDFWKNDKWPKAKHKLQWLIDKFDPPDWKQATKGMLYYTDNCAEERILGVVRNQLNKVQNGHQLVSVSQYPIDFGENIELPIGRSVLSMFKQILEGLERLTSEIVFFTEHDVLYHESHFDFTPPRNDVYYYNDNVWALDSKTGQALYYKGMKQVSGLCAYRELLLEHYRKRVEIVERDGFTRRMGFEPGKKKRHGGVDNYGYRYFTSEHPIVDIKHSNCLTPGRFKLEQYRCRERIKDSWILADEIPYWGKTKGRFEDFLRYVV
jgi:glycosyltransferase involved in cell wall biosynthesis